MDAPGDSVGLCATCRFRRTIEGARSVFYLCERSFTDPRYPRYPRLPVVACEGYNRQPFPPAADPEETR